jgi:hypothetical protein
MYINHYVLDVRWPRSYEHGPQGVEGREGGAGGRPRRGGHADRELLRVWAVYEGQQRLTCKVDGHTRVYARNHMSIFMSRC